MHPSESLAVTLQGGLGNQMFQYAAARSISLRKAFSLVLDPTILTPPNRRSFQLDRFAIKAHVASHSELADAGFEEVCEASFHFDPAIADARGGSILRGYLQSELYFAEHRESIRDDFRLRCAFSPHSAEIEQRIRISAFPVALHVRDSKIDGPRGLEFHGLCTSAYYAKAIHILRALAPSDLTFFVFSDNPQFAREMIGEANVDTFVTGNEERPWEDIMLMAACRSHIVANSSFSWWGAWLADVEDHLVFAPRQWFSRHTLSPLNTVDLCPDNWIML